MRPIFMDVSIISLICLGQPCMHQISTWYDKMDRADMTHNTMYYFKKKQYIKIISLNIYFPFYYFFYKLFELHKINMEWNAKENTMYKVAVS